MKVKQFVSVMLSSLVLVFGLSTSVAVAVEANTDQNSTRTTTVAETNTTNQTTTLSDTEKKQLLERLAKRKTELKTRLTTAQKARLQTKCKAAQGLIAPIVSKVPGYEKGRGEVYSKVVNRLTEVSTKVKDKGISTADLDAAITTLQGKVTTFDTDLASYKQAVTDLKEMDCASDPEAFQASLQTARTALDKVKKDGTDIRSYVQDTIKPILKTIRDQLAPKATEN